MSLTVTADKLAEGLNALQEDTVLEALQQAQLLKLGRELGKVVEEILVAIDRTDPTYTGANPGMPGVTGTGKYSQWILTQWVKHAAAVKSAKWNLDQYGEAVKAGDGDKALAHLVAADKDHDRAATEHFDPSDMERATKVHVLLSKHRKLIVARRTEEHGVLPDISEYPHLEALEAAMDGIPAEAFFTGGEVARGTIDPSVIPGSRAIFQKGGSIIFEINTVTAAMYHGAGTQMCFSEEGYAIKYIRRGPLYMAYSKVPEVTSSFPTAPEAQNLPDYKKLYAFTWDSMFGQNLGDPRWGIHLWEIRDTSNTWLRSSRLEPIKGLIEIMRGFTEGRNRGFDAWVEASDRDTYLSGKDPAEIAPDTGKPEKRITVAEYGEDEQPRTPRADPEDEDEDEEAGEGIHPEAENLISDFGLRIDGDGDISIGFSDNDPRDQANKEYFESEYPSEAYPNGVGYFQASFSDVTLWRDLRSHLEGESLDETREFEIRSEAEAGDWSTEQKEFKEALQTRIWQIGVEETPGGEDEDDTFALGVRYSEWEEAIDAYDDWLSYLGEEHEIYYEWDEYPAILYADYIKSIDREEASVLRKLLGLESEAEKRLKGEIATGQQFFPYVKPEEIEFESIMNRMVTPSRIATQRKDRDDMLNILYGIPATLTR